VLLTLILTLLAFAVAARVTVRVFTVLRLDPWTLLIYFGLAEYRAPAVSRRPGR
jgi:hypothetical protein